MTRRDFLTASAAVGLAAATPLSSFAKEKAEAQEKKPLEYYELRKYLLKPGAQAQRLDDYLHNAALPAMKKMGIGSVGVFNVVNGQDNPVTYVLITHKSPESAVSVSARLSADKAFQKAADEYLSAPPSDPNYIRMESTLLSAFEGMPRIELPLDGAKENKPRIFELRTYESHSERAGRKKIEMFNNGEIAIFRRNNLKPVFFGKTIFGTKMPSLTYMLVFDDMDSRAKSWGAFVADPDWKKLSQTPGYTDKEIVSSISNVFLTPTPYSEI
jgi:hypothetical protein